MKWTSESAAAETELKRQSPAPIQVTMLADATGKVPKLVNAVAVVEDIRGPKYQKAIEALRVAFSHELKTAHGDYAAAKRAVDPMKKRLPAVQWSGTFTGRGDRALSNYSFFICADLDNLEKSQAADAREKLECDPHVFALFASPTETGLKVVFAVAGDAAKHQGNFLAVKQHVAQVCGLAVDESCKNVERLCFVSYDPEAHLNAAAVPLATVTQEARPALAPEPVSGPVDLNTRQTIAGGLLGRIDWVSATRGFVVCPGRSLHTTGDAKRDCEVLLDGAPTIHCLHQHCAGIVAGVNHELRSQVGKAESGSASIFGRRGSVSAEYQPDEVEQEEPDPAITAPAWPKPLAPEALHGLAGDVVRAIDPHTESDPVAVLVMLLAAFGNMVGATAHFMAEARKHYTRVWPVLVGETAKGRKGSAWSSLRFVLEMVDPAWLEACTASGVSSGEGLIFCVRDPVIRHKKGNDGNVEDVVVTEGVEDKRLLTIEEEFSSVLKVAARDGCTVSDMMRRAWDSGDLRNMTKNNALRATNVHITVIGHITRADLSRLLAEGEALNGFGNRFLWCAVKRSKLLPEGGDLQNADLAPIVLALRRAVDHARTATLLRRSPEAKAFWFKLYPSLTADRFGLIGAITNRAEAQVMRLALIYALLDCSPQIEVPHLRAALALWDYCDRSSRFIFGEALGDKVADRILDELRCAGPNGLTRNDLRELFKRNLSGSKIEAALAMLSRFSLAGWAKEPRQGAGRPAIVWRACRAVQQPPEIPAPTDRVTASSQALPTQAAEPEEPAVEQEAAPEPQAQLVGVTDTDLL